MENPVDHTLGRSIQVGIHGEKLLGMRKGECGMN